jgi:hypothetical protein
MALEKEVRQVKVNFVIGKKADKEPVRIANLGLGQRTADKSKEQNLKSKRHSSCVSVLY